MNTFLRDLRIIVRSTLSGQLIEVRLGDLRWAPPDMGSDGEMSRAQVRTRLEPEDPNWRPWLDAGAGPLHPITLLTSAEIEWICGVAEGAAKLVGEVRRLERDGCLSPIRRPSDG